MPHAIRIQDTGGPEVLRWVTVELPPPGEGEARVRHTAVGLNFVDTYYRTGLYSTVLPAILGSEACGVVEAVGPGVTEVAVGDRVAYGTGPLGAYAESRNMPAGVLVKVPKDIDDHVPAAIMLKGLTAHYLLEIGRSAGMKTILFHAAAGGVGLLFCQWAKKEGFTVIGTVGSEEKAELARANGCDHTILYRHESIPERVRALTGGAGVDVVYDSVGKDTFQESLDSVRARGLVVSFGQSSGPIGPFEPRLLTAKGSLFLTRPTLNSYTADRAELVRRSEELFAAVGRGDLRVRIDQTYPLRDAERAHRDLEARKTTGSTVLLP